MLSNFTWRHLSEGVRVSGQWNTRTQAQAAQLTTAKWWKPPVCSSSNKWKKSFTCTLRYYSAIKNDKLQSSVEKCVFLETIKSSDINQTHKCKCCMVLLHEKPKLNHWRVKLELARSVPGKAGSGEAGMEERKDEKNKVSCVSCLNQLHRMNLITVYSKRTNK